MQHPSASDSALQVMSLCYQLTFTMRNMRVCKCGKPRSCMCLQLACTAWCLSWQCPTQRTGVNGVSDLRVLQPRRGEAGGE